MALEAQAKALELSRTAVAHLEQGLRLRPEQARRLAEFLAWNARPEHADYRYDYFTDNCSTKLRDALDAALDGALQAQLPDRRALLQPVQLELARVARRDLGQQRARGVRGDQDERAAGGHPAEGGQHRGVAHVVGHAATDGGGGSAEIDSAIVAGDVPRDIVHDADDEERIPFRAKVHGARQLVAARAGRNAACRCSSRYAVFVPLGRDADSAGADRGKNLPRRRIHGDSVCVLRIDVADLSQQFGVLKPPQLREHRLELLWQLRSDVCGCRCECRANGLGQRVELRLQLADLRSPIRDLPFLFGNDLRQRCIDHSLLLD